MPLPKPKGSEDRNKFLSRCMGNKAMRVEFPKKDQRYAVCNSQWRRKGDWDKHKKKK